MNVDIQKSADLQCGSLAMQDSVVMSKLKQLNGSNAKMQRTLYMQEIHSSVNFVYAEQ